MSSIDRLWAPWRLAYITEDEKLREKRTIADRVEVLEGGEVDCFLCQAVTDIGAEKRRHILQRTELTIAVLNKFPYNNGHLLIAPKRHLGRLDELTEAERNELGERVSYWVTILEKVIMPEGFNIGLNLGHAAGAGLPGHLHWHIVPRWNGDTNFMTSLASVKVIPQSLEELWTILVDNTRHIRKL